MDALPGELSGCKLARILCNSVHNCNCSPSLTSLANQTLLTPASYAKFILIPILLLHGLFVYASTLNLTLRASPLVGYELALTNPKQSVAVHYPGVCATTILTVVSHDHGWMGCALLSSILGGVVLGNVLRIQSGILNESGSDTSVCGESSYGVEDNVVEGGGDNAATTKLKAGAFPYLALRLPFELHAGYSLSSVALYLVAFLDGFDGLPRMVQLIVSNLCLVGLLGFGTWVLWKVPDRKFYGVGLALVWYLLGVAVELREPSQPIYNAFSDAAILTTQVVAWISTTILASVLGVRAMKTAIKYNLFNCMGRLGGADLDASTATEEEDGLATDYVAA